MPKKVAIISKIDQLIQTLSTNRPIRYRDFCDRQDRLIGQYWLISVIGKSVVPHQIFEWSVCFKRSPKNQNTFHLLKKFLPLNCTFSWIFGALCLVLSNQNKSEPILEVPPHCNTNDLSRKQDQDLLWLYLCRV